MRMILFLSGLICFQSLTFSQKKDPFDFWISSVNKAGYSRITYAFKNDSVTIKKGPYDFIYFAKNYEKDKIITAFPLNEAQINELHQLGSALKTDSLESIYSNLCIIDGLILHFHFEWGTVEKSTTISNYYLLAMVPLINAANRVLPEEYQINYDKEWLEKLRKDCPPDRILD